MMKKIDEEPNFLFIVFSDEATFEVNDNVNRHNCRYGFENPHWTLQAHIQCPKKLNV